MILRIGFVAQLFDQCRTGERFVRVDTDTTTSSSRGSEELATTKTPPEDWRARLPAKKVWYGCSCLGFRRVAPSSVSKDNAATEEIEEQQEEEWEPPALPLKNTSRSTLPASFAVPHQYLAARVLPVACASTPLVRPPRTGSPPLNIAATDRTYPWLAWPVGFLAMSCVSTRRDSSEHWCVCESPTFEPPVKVDIRSVCV